MEFLQKCSGNPSEGRKKKTEKQDTENKHKMKHKMAD